MTDPAVLARIKSIVEGHDAVLFMKGNPARPQCGFSSVVVQILDHIGVAYFDVDVLSQLGVKFHGINILTDGDLRQGIKEFSQWPTIPQLYVKGEFVGGCDIIREMAETGELEQLMKEKGVTLARAA